MMKAFSIAGLCSHCHTALAQRRRIRPATRCDGATISAKTLSLSSGEGVNGKRARLSHPTVYRYYLASDVGCLI
jgi:hypothetical protein